MGIECVTTILEKLGHKVLLVDFMAESIRHFKKYMKEFQPDVVGLTSQCSDITNVLYLVEKVKEMNHNIIVIVGGVQATIIPEAYYMILSPNKLDKITIGSCSGKAEPVKNQKGMLDCSNIPLNLKNINLKLVPN